MATRLGLDHVPAGWFGALPTTAQAIARDIRHDLELLADTLLGDNIRPPGWTGSDPLMRCDRSTQNLVELLQRQGLFTPNLLAGNPDYCRLMAAQVGQFTEINLLNQQIVPLPTEAAPAQTTSGGESSLPSAPPSGASYFAVEDLGLAFLDRYATRFVGTVPNNVPFTPVARSYTQFSHMTLVQGDQFEVFVDYKTTTIDTNTFNTLPDMNSFPGSPVCGASWCQPERKIAGMESRTSSQRLASGGLINAGTNMVIYYDGDDQNGMTRVRMKLCDRPTVTNQAICEPATAMILPDGSAAVPVGTVDGLLQFYAPYAYTTTSVRSANLYTIDLWIDPPEFR